MAPNEILLSLLAAQEGDDVVGRAMPSAIFGLSGEIGPHGFGATTLESHLALFTHPEFYRVAGLPPGLAAVEATAEQAAEYARAMGLKGFVLNPGTHQRFLPLSAWNPEAPPPAPPPVPVLAPLREPEEGLVAAVRAAAESSDVEAVWLAEGPIVATKPHPDPAFEAGLLARDVRIRSYGASLWWPAAFAQAGKAAARASFAPLAESLDDEFEAALRAAASEHGLSELWALTATFEGQPAVLSLAYAPHPHDAFAAAFVSLYDREATAPLLSAEALREALPKIGTRIL